MVGSDDGGKKFGNGVMRVNGEIVVLPVTEIIPENEFSILKLNMKAPQKKSP